MKREEIISGLQMTMDLIQFDPGTGNVRPVYELNDLDKTTYLACKAAIEALKAQDDTDTNVGNNDLISRSDAIDAVDKLSDEPIGYLEAAIDALVDLPSAQPEIIRCNDCKHWDTSWENNFAPNYHYCPLIDGTRRGDFYCADAERRTDEQ